MSRTLATSISISGDSKDEQNPSSASTLLAGRLKHFAWVLAVLIIFLTGVWTWTSGLSGPYHFDDYVTPLNDPASQSLADWQEYLPVTLRPVSKLSYAIEADAGLTPEPATRRMVSLLMHAVSAGLLFLLIVRLTPMSTQGTTLGTTSGLASGAKPGSVTGSATGATMGLIPLVAAFIAALWFIHPVHADSVLLLSGRTAVLAGLFLLASLIALDRSQSWLAALLFVLACLSRETALAGLLPLAVLAASRVNASFRSTLRELAPALLGGALVVAWILTTQRYVNLAEYSFLGRPFWPSLASQVGAVPVGLAVLFNPSALSIDYGIPLPTRIFDPLFLLGAGLYLLAAIGIMVFLRRSRAVAVGLALWLAALLPTQSVVPKLDALTNRPLSFALAGLLLLAAPMLAAGMGRLINRVANRRYGPAPARTILACAALGLLLTLSAATTQRSTLFGSELSLWHDAAVKSRSNARPHLQYAALLKQAGRDREAYHAVLRAQTIDPFSSQVAVFVTSYHLDEVNP